ncbi:Transmembrane protein [Actinidia chinensis var. chinensis]|uniref:Transmembrane protein n=1 Tax=Actinidia chinensis var. chinensis TaxID=1590841 RepID=A0A2R6R2F8_ACTCC|nr:uncharacterized protein LOC130785728 [Actinidia eriantha]PSS19427.1 Transmembrane protein [Actinidia chinensis var. chinensis]
MDMAELWSILAPAVAGAVFGAGWWFWVDAVVCSSSKISLLHYLPGIFASLGAFMFCCVRREDVDYSPYEDSEERLKLWLFLAYVVSFVSLAAAVTLLIHDSQVKSGPSSWTGTAGVLQCVFVFISGLIFWASHVDN